MNIVITIMATLIAILFPLSVFAEPSKSIEKLLDTPASAFDVFLFHIHEKGKCSHDEELYSSCLSTITYNFADNIIQIDFFVGMNHPFLKRASGKSQKFKEEALTSVFNINLRSVGVQKAPWQDDYDGYIQKIPIRYGWGTKNLDEDKIREEIRQRTKVILTTVFDEDLYQVVRTHHGKIIITKNNPSW